MPGRCPVGRTSPLNMQAWLYPMTSTEAVRRAPEALDAVDIVFIDGAHDFDNVVMDLRVWWPRLTVGGYMAGHDFSMSDPGIMQAIWLFFSRLSGDDRVNIVLDSDYTWWVHKMLLQSCSLCETTDP